MFKRYWWMFLAMVPLGSIVGLLVAPGPGDETRRRIARYSIEDQERLLRLAEMGSDVLNDEVDLPASA